MHMRSHSLSKNIWNFCASVFVDNLLSIEPFLKKVILPLDINLLCHSARKMFLDQVEKVECGAYGAFLHLIAHMMYRK